MLTSLKLQLSSSALATALLLGAVSEARAQTTAPPPPDSRLEDTEIVIEKSRKNELPAAGRNFDRVPFTPPPQPKRQVRYDFPDFQIKKNPLPVQPRVAPIRQEASTPVPGLLGELGYGNYGTLYARLGAHTKPSDQYHAGFDLRHQGSSSGPVDDKNSGAGNTRLEANGEGYTKTAAFGANVAFERDYTHFYGYSAEVKDLFKGKADDLLQTHTRFSGEVTARTTDARQPFQAEAGLGFRTWQNKTDSKETDFRPRATLSYAADPTNRIVLRTQASFLKYTNALEKSASRPNATATVAFEHDGERVDASLGGAVGYSGDSLNQDKKLNFYPAIRLGLEAVEDRFVILLGLEGGMDRVDMYSLTRQNPWLSDSIRVGDTNRLLSGYGGFVLTPARGTRLLVRGTYNVLRNLYFFNGKADDSTRFTLEYDGNDSVKVKNLNVHAELTMELGARFQLAVKGDYDNWDLATLTQPWHRPNWQASASLTYNAADKVLVGAELYAVGPSYGQGGLRKAPNDAIVRSERQTDTVIDLNARLDYRFTPRLSIFVAGQNLLGSKYQRYLNYPTRGLTAIGGLGFQF